MSVDVEGLLEMVADHREQCPTDWEEIRKLLPLGEVAAMVECYEAVGALGRARAEANAASIAAKNAMAVRAGLREHALAWDGEARTRAFDAAAAVEALADRIAAEEEKT